MIILGCDKVCWVASRRGYSLTYAWHGGSSRSSSAPGGHKNHTFGLLSLGFLCLVGWTCGGSTLGTCPSVRWVPICGMGWIRRTNNVRDCDSRKTSQTSQEFILTRRKTFKPMRGHVKNESPSSSKYFDLVITCSGSLARIIIRSRIASFPASLSCRLYSSLRPDWRMFYDQGMFYYFQQDMLLEAAIVLAVGIVPAEEDARLHLHSRGDRLLGHAGGWREVRSTRFNRVYVPRLAPADLLLIPAHGWNISHGQEPVYV
jgi:hypothetical protein